MSLIETLTAWGASTAAWDEGDSAEALKLLTIQAPCSKLLFNIGCAQLALRQYAAAIQTFSETIKKDQHMAVAYFQRGIVYFKAQRLQDAMQDFQECQRRFRGLRVIDYTQLGIPHKLYLCEAIYNAGVVQAHRGNKSEAEELIRRAHETKVELRHRVIGEAVKKVQAGGLPGLIELPRDAIYRPPKSKLDNIQKKDYLGKAKVISSINHEDDFSGFTGPRMVEEKGIGRGPQHEPRHRPSVPALNLKYGNEKSSPILPRRDGEMRRKSEGDVLMKPLPPPPSRPPPKLSRKPLPELPENEESPGSPMKIDKV